MGNEQTRRGEVPSKEEDRSVVRPLLNCRLGAIEEFEFGRFISYLIFLSYFRIMFYVALFLLMSLALYLQ
ncbi:unnamed protein product [Cuscuta europaea]|uniref:Uncharacterized protein n=1 Tax=Cuscuta europaea TaxID=41803 RepID=A0A9P1E3P2_CUSEU|nr:unnamed protein product [Cuscuta europaea]